MANFSNLSAKVQELATNIMDEHRDYLFEQAEQGKANFDWTAFFYDIVHEEVDREFIYVGLVDCAEIIEQAEHIETDAGLWEGLDPEAAINAMAFYTLKNEVMSELRGIVVDEIDEKIGLLEEEIEEVEDSIFFKEDELASMKAELEELELDEEDEEQTASLKQDIDEVSDELEELNDTLSDLENFMYNLETIRKAVWPKEDDSWSVHFYSRK